MGSKFKKRRKGLNVSDNKKQRKKTPAHICWRQNELEQGQRNVKRTRFGAKTRSKSQIYTLVYEPSVLG